MAHVRVFLGIGLLVAGCAVNQGAATPTPTSPEPIAQMTAVISSVPATPTPTSPEPIAQMTAVISSVPATASPSSAQSTSSAPPSTPRPSCLASSVLTVREFVEADRACPGGVDVSIRAWADTPFATGWEAPFIEPGWLAYPPDGMSMLWGVPPTGEEHSCSVDVDPACSALFIHVRPGSGLTLGDKPGWVIVTGHVGDSAADTCHYVVGQDWPGDPPDDESARNDCRGNFVLTGVSPARG